MNFLEALQSGYPIINRDTKRILSKVEVDSILRNGIKVELYYSEVIGTWDVIQPEVKINRGDFLAMCSETLKEVYSLQRNVYMDHDFSNHDVVKVLTKKLFGE